MAKMKTVYFSSGVIINTTASKAQLKSIIKTHLYYFHTPDEKPCRYWFRECQAWRDAADQYYRWFKANQKLLFARLYPGSVGGANYAY